MHAGLGRPWKPLGPIRRSFQVPFVAIKEAQHKCKREGGGELVPVTVFMPSAPLQPAMLKTR